MAKKGGKGNRPTDTFGGFVRDSFLSAVDFHSELARTAADTLDTYSKRIGTPKKKKKKKKKK